MIQPKSLHVIIFLLLGLTAGWGVSGVLAKTVYTRPYLLQSEDPSEMEMVWQTSTDLGAGWVRWGYSEDNLDHLTDAYSFGVLAYELLTGEPPFSGDDSLDLFLKHTSERPDAPSERKPGLPAAVDDVVLALLAKEPAERPAPLGEVVRSLAKAAGEPGLPASDPVEPPSIAYKDTLPVSESESRPRTGARLLWPGIAVACVAAGAVVLMTRKRPPALHESQSAPSSTAPASTSADKSSSVASSSIAVAPAPEPPPQVVVDVEGTPAGTEVLAPDGGVLGKAPGKLRLPSGSAPIEIAFRKGGFTTVKRTVSSDKNSVLVVHLHKAVKSRRAPSAKKPVAASRKKKPGPDDFEDPFK